MGRAHDSVRRIFVSRSSIIRNVLGGGLASFALALVAGAGQALGQAAIQTAPDSPHTAVSCVGDPHAAGS